MDIDFHVNIAGEVLGQKEADYLKRKHTGGLSNEKGNDMEEQFAVAKIAEGIGKWIANQECDLEINAQTPTYVDDFDIQNPQDNSRKSYQLKNSTNVSWNAGSNPIAKDFEYQLKLLEIQNYSTIETVLTVSCPELAKKLGNDIPKSISDHSRSKYFNCEPLNVQLLKKEEIFYNLSEICVSDSIDKLTSLHTIIRGVWGNFKGDISKISEFTSKIQENNPHFLRSFNEQIVLDSGVKKILDNIGGFSYKIIAKNLIYSYDSGRGIIDGTIILQDPAEEAVFLSKVSEEEPKTFSDLIRLGIL